MAITYVWQAGGNWIGTVDGVPTVLSPAQIAEVQARGLAPPPSPQAPAVPWTNTNAPAPVAPTPAPAPTAPAAPQYQHQGPTSGFSFGNLTGDQTVAYDDPSNRAVGWQKFSDYLNPNNTSANYGRWLSGQLGDQFSRFNVSQFQDPKNTGNDWLSYLEKLAPGMRQQFLGLSSAQTGNNYGNYESGNWLG